MNQKGFANIILVVAIVILVGVVGYFLFTKKPKPVTPQSSSPVTNIPSHGTTLPTPTPTSTPSSPIPQPTSGVNQGNSFFMKVNGETIPFTEDKRIFGTTAEILNNKFNIGTLREEGGLFELTGLDADKLSIGSFSGKEFTLRLLSSKYKIGACTDEKFKNYSRLVIKEYGDKIRGYYGGKLDCDGIIVEFQAPFDSQTPTPEWYTTN